MRDPAQYLDAARASLIAGLEAEITAHEAANPNTPPFSAPPASRIHVGGRKPVPEAPAIILRLVSPLTHSGYDNSFESWDTELTVLVEVHYHEAHETDESEMDRRASAWATVITRLLTDRPPDGSETAWGGPVVQAVTWEPVGFDGEDTQDIRGRIRGRFDLEVRDEIGVRT